MLVGDGACLLFWGMVVLPAYVPVVHIHVVLLEARGEVGSSGTRITDGYELP